MVNHAGPVDDDRLEFTARVKAVLPNGIVLETTFFERATDRRAGDRGFLGHKPVTAVTTFGGDDVLHEMTAPAVLRAVRLGDQILGSVDLAHRRSLECHDLLAHLFRFACQELLDGEAYQGDYVSAAGVITRLHCRRNQVDSAVSTLVQWVGMAIEDDLSVSPLRVHANPGRQFVHIDGIGSMGCRHAHPRRTGVLGAVELVDCTVRERDVVLSVRASGATSLYLA